MKKMIAAMMICLTISAAACNKAEQPVDITEISDGSFAADDSDPGEDPQLPFDPNTAVLKDEPETDDFKDPSATDVDVDLTVLSSTMVYGEVFYMMNTPAKYRGKTVRMEGLHAVYTDSESGIVYHYCIVQDATACCSTGIEFRLEEGTEYPEGGKNVRVVGVFETYEEGGEQYATLTDARIE